MANSAYSVGTAPEMSYSSSDYGIKGSDGTTVGFSGSSVPGFLAKLFGGVDFDKLDERQYQIAQENSARAFNEYMDSTKYQRAVQDLKKAGLNPYMMAMNGFGSGSSAVSAGSSGSSSGSSSESSAKGIAALLGALAKLLAL